jgi:XRE family transcriptional regulator, fatty acid utilization regulator
VTAQLTACATSLAAGKRIRVLRKKAGWSQRRLGAEAGLSSGAVSFAETGRRNLTLPALERVAKALGTDVGSLVAPGRGNR